MVDKSDVADLDPFDLLDHEADRVYEFFTSIDDATWNNDTRCEGWRVRELLSHLDGVEVYHLACLNDDIQALFAKGAEAGATDMDSFNAWVVRERAEKPMQEVLESWRAANTEVRRRVRELGRDGTMASSVGPYPVDLMAFHIASEYATHADDMAVEIPESEHDERLAWREKVSRFGVKEAGKPVEVELSGESYTVRIGNEECVLSRRDFVDAVTARLPADYPIEPELREGLRALA